ncbi:MAG: hypothetical protein NVV79_21795 [Devosia ginsengisoli]|nr:hypothetical protein [Devosia ginsengisoli]MCR6673886.1 hypothetical protein [Devosia ginsengisoli]
MLAGHLLEARIVEAENVADRFEVVELGLMHQAVGRGDIEQTVEHMLERIGTVVEEARDLAGIGVVAGDILLGQVEHADHLLFMAMGDFHRGAEGALLGGGHRAVGHRHLGGERDQRQGEGGVAPTRQPGIGVERIDQRPRQAGALAERADQVAQSLPHVDFLFGLAHAIHYRLRLLEGIGRASCPSTDRITIADSAVHCRRRMAASRQSAKKKESTSRAMTRARERLGPSSR